MGIEKYKNQPQEIPPEGGLTEAEKSSIETRKTIKEELARLKNDWSDEKPPRIVDGKDTEYKHNKYRKNWFAAVVLALEILAGEGLLSEDTKEEIKKFEKDYTSNAFKERLTKEEDIKKANFLIEKVFQEIEERQS